MQFQDLLSLLDRATPCVWVVVAGVRGSAPREEGAGMAVTLASATGTIGGGHLELKAIELAREWLRLGKTSAMQRHYPLGPALGQCCGGAVDLLFRPVTLAERPWVQALAIAERDGGDIALATLPDAGSPHTCLAAAASTDAVVTRHSFRPWHVWVFGAGHVGKALVQVFGTLPCVLTWVDSREAQYPAMLAQNVRVLHSDHPADEVDDIPEGADVLVLTHSHALDLDIVTQLLRREDLGYLGMIGSDTKARLFQRRLAERGLEASRLTCPIGAPVAGSRNKSPCDKHPGAIAVSVAADLLARRAAHAPQVAHA
jgi:xanthine dehydrogenase accessory factor